MKKALLIATAFLLATSFTSLAENLDSNGNRLPFAADTTLRLSPSNIYISLGEKSAANEWDSNIYNSIYTRDNQICSFPAEPKIRTWENGYYAKTLPIRVPGNKTKESEPDKAYKVAITQSTLSSSFLFSIAEENGTKHGYGLTVYNGIDQSYRDYTNHGYYGLFTKTANSAYVNPFMTAQKVNDSYVATPSYQRANEYTQAMAASAAIDYNLDGKDDIVLMFGNKLFFFETNNFHQTDGFELITTENGVCMPSISVADYDGDGREDIMVFVTTCEKSSSNPENISFSSDVFFLAGSTFVSSGKIEKTNIKHLHLNNALEWVDANNSVTAVNKNIERITHDAAAFYFISRTSQPAVALAARTVNRTLKNNGTTEADEFSVTDQLNIYTVNPSELSKDNGNWFTRVKTASNNRNPEFGGGQLLPGDAHRWQVNFVSGRPALASALTDGINSPATLLWDNNVYRLDVSQNGTTLNYALNKLTDYDFSFTTTRALTPMAAVIKNTDGSFPFDGKECYIAPVVISAMKQVDNGDYFFADNGVNTCVIFKDGDHFKYTESYASTADEPNMFNTSLSMAALNAHKNVDVKFDSTTGREMMYMSPVVQAVLVVPPYIKNWNAGAPQTKFTTITTDTDADSKTHSKTATFGCSVGPEVPGFVSQVISSSSLTNTSTMGSSVTTESSVDHTAAHTIVAYQYLPVYRYTYYFNTPAFKDNARQPIYFYEAFKAIQSDVKLLADFNANVAEPNGIPTISVSSTEGDPSTYVQAPRIDVTSNDILALFGNPKFAMMSKSQLFENVSVGVSTGTTLKMAQAKSEGTSESSSTSVGMSVKSGGGIFSPVSITVNGSIAKAESWSQTTTFGTGTSFSGTTPGLITKAGFENYSYDYGQIVYKKTVRSKKENGVWVVDNDTTNNVVDNNHYVQEYLVSDWYVCNYISPESMRRVGDANNDGVVDIVDINAVISKILGDEPANFNEFNADVNLDNVIDIMDINGILNLILNATAAAQ